MANEESVCPSMPNFSKQSSGTGSLPSALGLGRLAGTSVSSAGGGVGSTPRTPGRNLEESPRESIAGRGRAQSRLGGYLTDAFQPIHTRVTSESISMQAAGHRV